MSSFIDKIKIKFNKEFRNNYKEFNIFKEVIKEFISEYGKDSSKVDYIDEKTKKTIINKNNNSFKICDYLKDYKDFISKEDILIIDEFLDVYSDFDRYCLKINTKFIDTIYKDFIKSKYRVKKLIEDLTSNVSYDNLLNKNQIADDFKEDYELSKRLMDYKSSDDYFLKDEKLIKEFIKTYSNLDSCVEKINNEVKRRDDLFKEYINNKSNIKEFNTYYMNNISDNLYIDDSKEILDEYGLSYESALNIKPLVSDNDELLVNDFISIYEDFDNVSKTINENYLKRKYEEFISKKEEIKDFCKKYKFEISYEKSIDDENKENIFSTYKYDYDLLYDLNDKNFNFKNEDDLVHDFMKIYENFFNIVDEINIEVKRRDNLFKDYVENKSVIDNFIFKYKTNVSLDLYIDDYKFVLNEYSSVYKLCVDLNYLDVDFDKSVIIEFIDIYSNFKVISSKINTKFIDKEYYEFIMSKENIREFVNDLTVNVSFDKLLDKNQLMDDFKDKYNLSKRLIDYKKSDNYNLKDENLINEFIDTYFNLDKIVKNINIEVKRRNGLFKEYVDNRSTINNFIIKYKTNISSDLYIDDYKFVLNEYSSVYKLCVDLNCLDVDFDKSVIIEFIDIYSNFKVISSKINTQFIDKEYYKFIMSKENIREFVNDLTVNVSFDKLLDKNQLMDDFKDKYNLSKRLIDYKKSDNYNLKHENLINEFINTYSDLDNIVKNINDEVKRRDVLFKDYINNYNRVNEFIHTYKTNISPDLYIDDYKAILNEYSSIYKLCSELNNIEDNFDKTVINDFIKLYSNFRYSSSKINKAFIDKVYEKFIPVRVNINSFCIRFKFNIPYNLLVDNDSKIKSLSEVNGEYNLSKRLMEYKKTDNYSLKSEDNKLINIFINLYENFDSVINEINNGYERRIELRNSFLENKNSILLFISTYKTDISKELYIEDYNSILTDFSKLYELCNELNNLSKCYSLDIDEDLINEFLEIYDNFEDISLIINDNYFKYKYNIFLKSKNEILQDLDNFNNLNVDLYLKNKESFIKNFKIKNELLEILLKFKDKLDKTDLKIINDYINLYNQFNGKFIEKCEKRFKNKKHVLTKTINKYTINLNYEVYISDKEEYLKKYGDNINFVRGILKLHENNELKLEENDLEKIHTYLNLFDNFDEIIIKNNNGYAEKIYNEYLELKNKISYFVKRYENTPLLKSYIDKNKKNKILSDNLNNYNLLNEINSIPESSQFCKKADTKLLSDFLEIYNDFDDIIININKRFVNKVYEENIPYISQYVDLVNLSQDFYVSNMKLNDLLDNYDINHALVKKMLKFCNDFKYIGDESILNQFPPKSSIKKNYEKANKSFIKNELKTNKKFFNNINGHSLDDQQREAVIIDEDTNQIIAGAGTGKTLTLQAKIKYLIQKRGVSEEDIIALSYSNASVDDLKDKISENIDIKTIHSLGYNILEKNGEKPNADNNAINRVIDDYFLNEVLKDSNKAKKIIEFYSYYRYPPTSLEDLSTKGELYQKEAGRDFESLKSKTYSYIENDYSDGYVTFNREYVKSLEELYIANFLYINGVDYIYERTFKGKTKEYYILFNFIKSNSELPLKEIVQLVRDIADDLYILEEEYVDETQYNRYKPDFYLPEYDIYIEHFGVDRNCKANWLNKKDSEKYSQQISWKRDLHKKYGTNLLETYSYYQKENRLLERLKEKLTDEGVIFNPISYSELYQNLINHENLDKISDLIKLIKTFINHFKGNNFRKSVFKKIKKSIDIESSEFIKIRHTILFNIIKDVYDKYQKYLKDKKLIDFNDMVNKAQKSINKKGCPLSYKYILVDEYQDVSFTRYSLIKSIQDAINSKVVVVGDDWQSIYRFSGCDVGLFSQIDKYFENVETRFIEQTYRNSQELIDVSGNFVMKNPLQIAKELNSEKNLENPIKIAYFETDPEEILVFKALIDTIISSDEYAGEEILVLGRNRRDIQKLVKGKYFDDEIFTYKGTIDSNFERYKCVKLTYLDNEDVNITYRTIHGSKGLQANYVIVINLKNNLIGFPNKIEDDPILKYVKLNDEPFEFAEERRLFYVSLTRTRGNCYLLTPKLNKSEFVEELEENDEHIEYIEKSFLQEVLNSNIVGSKYISLPTSLKCPECRTGDVKLMWHVNPEKRFLTCSHNHCDWIGGSYKEDVDDLNRIFECPECGDIVVKRSGRFGPFFACTNGLCDYTMDDFSDPSFEVHKTNLKCPKCNSNLKLVHSNEFEKGSFVCSNEDCSYNGGKFFGNLEDLEIYGLCPFCDGVLLKKNGIYGEFLGCSNWKRNTGCQFSRDLLMNDKPLDIFK